MTDPREVLKNLATKTDPAELVVRVYRMLYNPDLYWIAYGNLHPDEQTAGEDGICSDHEITGRIDRIIPLMREQAYRPAFRRKIP